MPEKRELREVQSIFQCHTSKTAPTLPDIRSVCCICCIPEDEHFLHPQLMQQSLRNNRAGLKYLRQFSGAVNSVVKGCLFKLMTSRGVMQ